MALATNWLSFSLSSIEMMRSSAESQFKPYETSSTRMRSSSLSSSHLRLLHLLYLQFLMNSFQYNIYPSKNQFLDVHALKKAIQVIVIDGYESVLDTGRSSDTPVNVLDIRFTISSESGSVSDTSTARVSSGAERDGVEKKSQWMLK